MWRARISERCHQVAGGLKALAALVLTIGLAAADYYDAVPMASILKQVFGDNAAEKLAIWLPIIFGTLRYVSTNQVRWQHSTDEGH